MGDRCKMGPQIDIFFTCFGGGSLLRFWIDFRTILETCWVKKRFPKIASKKVTRQIQTAAYSNARRLPDSPPRARAV